jgi:hypothetical protein
MSRHARFGCWLGLCSGRPRGHPHQVGVVWSVSRRAITSIMTQRTLDSEVFGRLS